jgi:hypothetical protein
MKLGSIAALLMIVGPAAAAPLPPSHPIGFQVTRRVVSDPKVASELRVERRLHTPGDEVCSVFSGPDDLQGLFVDSGCTPADGKSFLRWDPRTGMKRAPDVTAEWRFVSPRRLLNLHAWLPAEAFADGPARPSSEDYEVQLMSRGLGPVHSRVVRRSGEWLSTFDVAWDGRKSLTVENRPRRFLLGTSGDARSKTISFHGAYPGGAPLRPWEPVRLSREPDQMVMGETCNWWDFEPGVADAGLWECRTVDGLPLIVRTIHRGWPEDVFAVDVRRGRVPLSRVLPTAEKLSPKAWGFEG